MFNPPPSPNALYNLCTAPNDAIPVSNPDPMQNAPNLHQRNLWTVWVRLFKFGVYVEIHNGNKLE